MFPLDIASSSSCISSLSQADNSFSDNDVNVTCAYLAQCSGSSETNVVHVPPGDFNYNCEAMDVTTGDLSSAADAPLCAPCVADSLVPAIDPPKKGKEKRIRSPGGSPPLSTYVQ